MNRFVILAIVACCWLATGILAEEKKPVAPPTLLKELKDLEGTWESAEVEWKVDAGTMRAKMKIKLRANGEGALRVRYSLQGKGIFSFASFSYRPFDYRL